MRNCNNRSFYIVVILFFISCIWAFKVEYADAAPGIPYLPSGINSGSQTAYTTVDGVSFESDYGRNGGVRRTSTGEILNTDDDRLYHSRIVAPLGQEVTYRISPPQGVTELQVFGHFNEHYRQSSGARLIDVMIRCPGSGEPWNTGVMVEEELDIFSEAGARNTALVRDWGIVDISGGEIEITLSPSSNSPDAALISAIEFKDITRIPNLPTGINSGSQTDYTTVDGVLFESDYGRSGGVRRTSTGEILNTDDDTLYHSRIVAPLGQNVTYRVSPPQGVTEMRILGHFNEHYRQRAGARLIDVMIRCPGSGEPWNSGVMAEEGLDIFSAAGGRNTALVRDWGIVDVSGGEVEITLSPSSNSPDAALISAIEFSGQGACQPPVLDPIGDLWVGYRDDNTFLISATDPDTDDSDLTFEATLIPSDDFNPADENECYLDNQSRIYQCDFIHFRPYWGRHQERFRVCDDCSPEPLCDEEVVTVLTFVGKNYLAGKEYTHIHPDNINVPNPIEIVFADESHTQLGIHVWSLCNETDCEYGVADWGTAIVDYNGPNPMVATFEFEWGTVSLTIDPLTADADLDFLIITEHRDYNDGREDTDTSHVYEHSYIN